jgi:predicted aldo/keto reductase-like oxidoreductase
MLDYAYQQGVNYFDTAWGYMNGKSEAFVGSVLQKYPRDSFYLASKMPGWILKNLLEAEELFAAQLKRCEVEYFDYYLLHSLTTREEFDRLYLQEKVLDYLYREKQAGRIRKLGFSFHGTIELMKYLLENFPWDFGQIQLNYQDWDTMQARVLYELAIQHHLPCIIMEPVRGGALANLNDQAAAILKQAAPQSSLASWAIRFVASLPGVLTVLSGMSTMDQLKDNLKTTSDFQPLTAKEREFLQQALDAYLEVTPIPCTGCNYCLPCTFGVDIPGNFRAFNQGAGKQLLTDLAVQSEKREEFRKLWADLAPEARAGQCRSCGQCVPKCPQRIAIPERLQELQNLLDKIQ